MNDSSSLPAENDPAGDSTFEKRVRRHVIGRVQPYYAITVPGFEALCRRELLDLGCDSRAMTIDPGGVSFAGRFVDCQRANLHLRTATRVLMRIDTFVATHLRRLEKKAGEIAWELFLPADPLPDIKVSSHRSRLYHTAAIAQALQGSIARRLNGGGGAPSHDFPQTVFARVVEDRITLSVDSSGPALYKRGLKHGPARAPIRETLAASILLEAGYDARRPLVDPLCGSGTFSLEAAMMAKSMAPGGRRRFAFMGWPAFRENRWNSLKHAAEAQIASLDRPAIFASDVDAATCRRLTETVGDNGLADAVEVQQKDVFQCRAGQFGRQPGLVAINPPYGIRIGSAAQADRLFRKICQHLARHFKGWDVVLIAPRPHLARQLPFAARRIPLIHGGLKLTLVLGTIG